jgi:hypothetical protein
VEIYPRELLRIVNMDIGFAWQRMTKRTFHTGRCYLDASVRWLLTEKSTLCMISRGLFRWCVAKKMTAVEVEGFFSEFEVWRASSWNWWWVVVR